MGFLASSSGGLAFFGCAEVDAGATSFGKAYGDGLLAGADASAAAFEGAHFFAHEFAGLGGGFLSGASVSAGAFFRCCFGHESKGLLRKIISRGRTAIGVQPDCLRAAEAARPIAPERFTMAGVGTTPMSRGHARCYLPKNSAMSKKASTPKTARHVDDPNFRRSDGAVDEQRGAGKVGNQNPDTSGTHSDARYASERYGEQSAEQRRDSIQKEQTQNLGGQDSRDQSTKDRHSLLGREGEVDGEKEAQVARAQQRSSKVGEAGAESEPEPYASDTRDSFSRKMSDYQKREQERRTAAGGGDYDGNWTRDTDKPSQPGPAS